jgi:replication factor C subunit 1
MNKQLDLWINKYKPSEINQIIGNAEQIKTFKDWLVNLPNNKNQSIIICGNQGLGKTLTIKLILESLNYIVRIINPNEIKDHRILDDFNDYYNFLNSIYSKIQFNDSKNKKIALIFDETENITLTSEKKYIMEIYKENNKTKSFPLIFISNNQHSKLLNDLKKGCQEIVFTNPEMPELVNFVKILRNTKFFV